MDNVLKLMEFKSLKFRKDKCINSRIKRLSNSLQIKWESPINNLVQTEVDPLDSSVVTNDECTINNKILVRNKQSKLETDLNEVFLKHQLDQSVVYDIFLVLKRNGIQINQNIDDLDYSRECNIEYLNEFESEAKTKMFKTYQPSIFHLNNHNCVTQKLEIESYMPENNQIAEENIDFHELPLQFPLKSLQDLNKLETLCANLKNRFALVLNTIFLGKYFSFLHFFCIFQESIAKQYSPIGGRLHNVGLAKLIDDSILGLFNWSGTQRRLSFSNYHNVNSTLFSELNYFYFKLDFKIVLLNIIPTYSCMLLYAAA